MCLRLRCNEYIRRQNEFTQQLKLLGLKPGLSMFFTGVNVTKQLGFNQFNVACKWKRNYRRNQTTGGWFLLTLFINPASYYNCLSTAEWH